VHVVGKLALLPRRDEPRPQPVGDRRRDNEASRFDAENAIDAASDELIDDRVDDRREGDLVAEQRGDVLENDPRPGKVRDVADE
jgi:hypothetical protein